MRDTRIAAYVADMIEMAEEEMEGDAELGKCFG